MGTVHLFSQVASLIGRILVNFAAESAIQMSFAKCSTLGRPHCPVILPYGRLPGAMPWCSVIFTSCFTSGWDSRDICFVSRLSKDIKFNRKEAFSQSDDREQDLLVDEICFSRLTHSTRQGKHAAILHS